MLDDNKDLEQEGQETPEEQPVEAVAEETPTAETTPASETKEEEVKETAPAAETKEEPAEETTPAAETQEEAEAEATEEEPQVAEAEKAAEPVSEAEEEEDEEEDTDEEEDDIEDSGEESEEEEDEEEDEEVELPEEEPVVAETAHDDFDWSVGNKSGLGTSYSEGDIEKYTEQYESTLTTVFENEIVKGTVTSIHDGDVVLDINFKSDGLVSLSEFRDNPDLAVGDEVEVYVEQQEDARLPRQCSRHAVEPGGRSRSYREVVPEVRDRQRNRGNLPGENQHAGRADLGSADGDLQRGS